MSEMNPLLELAARNDAEGFKQAVDEDPSAVDAVDLWYGRKIGGGPTQMGLHHRTPLMVASSYGSLDVLRIILGFSDDVGRSCGPEKTTALHCAASSGAPRVTEAVELLLAAGADPNCVDADGRRPVDVIVAPFHSNSIRLEIVHLFGGGDTSSDSSDEGGSPSSDSTISSPMAATSSKVYPVDPSLPDIKMGIYSTDEFRMYSFKVRPCSRAYSHDWTECPFAHPGENARRRDPMRYNYSCVPCPDFRKGGCRRGDACEYAHGVFECWLHPAQYRTRLCKDAAACSRRVCFFAHTPQQLRTVHIPNSSPRSSAAIEMAMMSLLPLSPSSSAMDNHFPKPQVPMIHLPVQSSRLRSSLSARDVPVVRPNNLDRVFSGEISSPRYADHVTLLSSPSHKAAVLNHYHHLLSPINTPRPSDQSFSQASSPGRMSPLAEREKMLQLRSRDLAWGKLDWGANVDELDEDRDVSWVNSLVNTTEMDEKLVGCTRRAAQREDHAVLGSWLEQMQID